MTASSEAFSTKGDYAYSKVRDLILSGDLEPGAAINQEALARQIGLSVTPLREALRRLRQQGLVTLDAHRDARVAPLSAEEARDLLEVRRSLDPLAASLAAQRRTNAELAEMRAALAELAALTSNPSLDQLVQHRRFHTSVYRASHNTRLVDALDGLWDSADRYRRHGLRGAHSDEDRAVKDREHALLTEAIAEGDADTAADIMRAHIDTSLGAKSAWRLRGRTGAAADAE